MGAGRFTHLSVGGFRRLREVSFDLRPLTVAIGANGVGKTSLLDVFSLLARSAQGALSATLSEYSGLAANLTYDHADDLSLAISMNPRDDQRLNYLVRIQPQGTAHVIAEETLTQERHPYPHIDSRGSDVRYFDPRQNDLVAPTWGYSRLETSLSQAPKMFELPELFRSRLASCTSYHALNVDPRSPVRLPQQLQPASLPGRNGEDLVSCLYYLRETERHRFEAIEDALRAAFPRFERLEFPPVAAGTLALTWRESTFSKPLYMHQLSEGTLRFLWLATLLQSPGLTAITLIDEPEVSLHPELLSLLADLLREASQRAEIVVATHSDRLIRFMKPSEVLVMDENEEGMTTVKWADELDLGEWLKDYTLDQLWSNGRLGARS
ncbi:MAG: AAA family ATPase [Bryobacteraceae bacterium]|jgi:predicted ATPase